MHRQHSEHWLDLVKFENENLKICIKEWKLVELKMWHQFQLIALEEVVEEEEEDCEKVFSEHLNSKLKIKNNIYLLLY